MEMVEDNEVRITLRLTEALRDQLKDATDASGRSMNAEILTRLDLSFRFDQGLERFIDSHEAMAKDHFELVKEYGALEAQSDELKMELAATKAALAEQKAMSANLQHLLSENFEDAKKQGDRSPSQEEPIFNIVLDAKGHPISWPEIAAHIHRTAKAAGVEAVSFRAAVFDADRQSGGDRDREYARLVRWYQEQTKKYKDQIREE